ncbi:metallophosphoesterase [Flavobacterium agricola]|uniref:acid phosphatase n=1 Tax=Flavobacterium agricola TaxID=2870839 RepID=A0ABY6LXT3_9FLAO|nr:metallophosphoesterase [Flavobacterium agricola]UYW01049.1 metallophosphoesterase [Flavobacterium agricola]
MNKFIISLCVVVCQFYNASGQKRPDALFHTTAATSNQTIKPLKNGISFLAIGDFGRHGAYTQKEVAREMGVVAEILGIDFVVSVGDNFYPNGVQSTQDYQWISSFESIYTHHALHEPWYVALGNHDYAGNAQAQLDYSQISRRWEMPARYFEKLIEIDNGKFLQLLVLDTNPFIDKYQQNKEKYTGIEKQNTKKQLRWLEQKLANKNPEIVWKIVVGHHPLYSGGKRKTSKETLDIEAVFEPILEKHQVDAYITGHEHDLQVIQKPNKKLIQFLSGAGSELREAGTTEGTLFADSVPGFMAFSLNDKQLDVYVIEAKTNTYQVIYSQTLTK